MTLKKSYEILKILLKDCFNKHTVTTLAKVRGISRVGSWKILKELEKEKLIKLAPISSEKTSVNEVSLNWDNPLLEKILVLLLAEESLKQEKWRFNFKQIEDKVHFSLLFGSILHSQKQANDIDIINLVSNEKDFTKINKTLTDIQVSLDKKIHEINLTKKELIIEVKNNNKAYIEAIKKGVILFGHENFIKFIKEISK